MSDVFFWGTGQDANRIYCLEFKTNLELGGNLICGFIDNNSSKWGSEFYGYQIYSPQILQNRQYDYVVILSDHHYNEIYADASEKFNVDKNKILHWKDYLIKVNVLFNSRSLRVENYETKTCYLKKNIVIYTFVLSGDELCEPKFEAPNIRYKCFTDRKDIHSKVWDIITIPLSKKQIIKYMCLPHTYFEDFDISIWISNRIIVLGNINEFLTQYFGQSGMLCFPHRKRRCIYDLCADYLETKKTSVSLLMNQLLLYHRNGYPVDNGVYSTEILVRNHYDTELTKCLSDWWYDINDNDFCSEISLPYVLYKHNYTPDICDLDICSNEYFGIKNQFTLGN